MHVVELELNNWLRYRGQHKIALAPTVYGVVARHRLNEDRSNWLGKTSLMAAIRFALYGQHQRPTEDAWITNGERDGSVHVRCSDGTVIERRRERGKATRLSVTLDGRPVASGDDGQRLIEEHVGLTDDDFVATCYFAQKQINKFVVARPADRMAIIAGWLQLEPLQRAEKRVRSSLAALIDDEVRQGVRRDERRKAIVDELSRYFEVDGSALPSRQEVGDEMVAVCADLRATESAANAVRDEKRRAMVSLEGWRRAADDARKHRDLMATAAQIGTDDEIAAKVAKHLQSIEAARGGLDAVTGELRASTDKVKQVDQLRRGDFDGACPIDGHACPDCDAMNANAGINRKLVDDATVVLETVRARHANAKVRVESLTGELMRSRDDASRQSSMREQAARYLEASMRIARDGAPPDDDLEPAMREADDACGDATAKLREAEGAAKKLDSMYAAEAADAASLVGMRVQIAVKQQAIAILGRNGAQKRLAEGALGDIARMANESLCEAGIDLTISIAWSREGTGLSDECDACGAAFPKGRSVKECPRCGAQRGPKTVDKVVVDLSDTSGAAEDLAGVVIQLAAGAWLRSRRSSLWSAVFIDEPFGALDPANKCALASHLASLLRGRYGFEQAMVVAHDRGIMDSMPGRIIVEGDDDGSTMMVG